MSFVRHVSAGAIVAALFAFSFQSSAASGDYDRDDDLTMEVVSCEEAYARLEECCPDFDTPINACRHNRYRRTSCDGQVGYGGTNPVFVIEESECIRGKSCDALIAEGICKAYDGARPPKINDERARICQ